MKGKEYFEKLYGENYKYFLAIPNTDPQLFKAGTVKGSHLI